VKMTIDEILDLIDETKTADEAANFLIERLGDQSLEVSQDIALRSRRFSFSISLKRLA